MTRKSESVHGGGSHGSDQGDGATKHPREAATHSALHADAYDSPPPPPMSGSRSDAPRPAVTAKPEDKLTPETPKPGDTSHAAETAKPGDAGKLADGPKVSNPSETVKPAEADQVKQLKDEQIKQAEGLLKADPTGMREQLKLTEQETKILNRLEHGLLTGDTKDVQQALKEFKGNAASLINVSIAFKEEMSWDKIGTQVNLDVSGDDPKITMKDTNSGKKLQIDQDHQKGVNPNLDEKLTQMVRVHWNLESGQ